MAARQHLDIEDPLKASKKLLEDYRKLVEPDKHDLDECWINQPVYFDLVSDGLSEALRARDQAKDDYESEQSRADKYYRDRAAKAEEKLSESQVKHLIQLDDDVQSAFRTYLSWKEMADKWLGMKSAYEQRKDSLKGLTSLYVAGYFQTASGKAETRNATDRRAEEGREAMARKRTESK